MKQPLAHAMAVDPGLRAKPVSELRPRGCTRVALVGPDGVGKSTTIDLVRQWFAEELPNYQFEIRRWRPDLLPDLGLFAGKDQAPVKAVKPRRKPGRFHFLRIFYYYWDFLFGGWWKDRLRARAGTVVVYDRCALDMQVDPVRFGLRSPRGTEWLWRLAPRPELVIFLDDTSERICQRKQELEPHEVEAQLSHWRRLARAGVVHAIVRVDGQAEEVAERVRQLVFDQVVRNSGGSRPAPGQSVVEPTAPEPVEAVLAGNESAPKTFAVLPSRSHPRFLIPVSPRGAAGSSLAILNPQRWAGRVWRRGMSTGFATGLAPFLPIPKTTLNIGEFEGHLRSILDCGDISVAISLGRPGVHRKPVFQIMRPSGRVLAYAKLGWNSATIQLVQNEERALRSLGRAAFSTAIVPHVLHGGWFHRNYLLVQQAVDDAPGASAWNLDQRHVVFLRELAGLDLPSSRPSPDGGGTSERVDTIRDLGFEYYAYLVESALEFYGRQMAGIRVPLSAGHGDFAPWNIRIARNKLLVLDWEYARSVPPGWDLFHFLIGSAVELERRSGAEIYRDLVEGDGRRRLQAHFEALGLPGDWIEPLLVSWIADALSRNITLFEHAASPEDQACRRAWAAVLNLILNTRERHK